MVTGAQAPGAEQVRDLVGLPFDWVKDRVALVPAMMTACVAVLAGKLGQVHHAVPAACGSA